MSSLLLPMVQICTFAAPQSFKLQYQKFYTQSTHLLPFKPTYEPSSQLYPPKKLLYFLGSLVENFVTFRKSSQTFQRDCAQNITPSLSKFHTQSANLLPFKTTYELWPQLYPPKTYSTF